MSVNTLLMNWLTLFVLQTMIANNWLNENTYCRHANMSPPSYVVEVKSCNQDVVCILPFVPLSIALCFKKWLGLSYWKKCVSILRLFARAYFLQYSKVQWINYLLFDKEPVDQLPCRPTKILNLWTTLLVVRIQKQKSPSVVSQGASKFAIPLEEFCQYRMIIAYFKMLYFQLVVLF